MRFAESFSSGHKKVWRLRRLAQGTTVVPASPASTATIAGGVIRVESLAVGRSGHDPSGFGTKFA